MVNPCKYLQIFLFVCFSVLFGNEFEVQIDFSTPLEDAAEFRISDIENWQSEPIFTAEITVDPGNVSDEPVDIRLYFEGKMNGELAFRSITKAIEFQSGIPTTIESTEFSDPKYEMEDEEVLLDAEGLWNEVLNLGRVPSGTYSIIVYALQGSHSTGLADIENDILETTGRNYVELTVTAPSSPQLMQPANYSIVQETFPFFQWLSSGARSEILIQYQIRVCPILESQGLEEAIDNLSHWESQWGDIDIMADGTTAPISFAYPTVADPFVPGMEYTWQVQARDDAGIFGWDEQNPVVSEVFEFRHGELPTPTMPTDDEIVNTVIPTFQWTSVLHAEAYEIWIANSEDPVVENPDWDAIISTANYSYPTDAPALCPGETYYWKIRINQDQTPSEWSNISQFTISQIEILAPANGDKIHPHTTSFQWSAPAGISMYKIEMATDQVFGEIIFARDDISINNFQIPSDEELNWIENTDYFWRVSALSDCPAEKWIEGFFQIDYEFFRQAIQIISIEFIGDTLVVPVVKIAGNITHETVLEIAYDVDFSEIIFTSCQIADNFFTYPEDAPSLPFETLLYFRLYEVEIDMELSNLGVTSPKFHLQISSVGFDISFAENPKHPIINLLDVPEWTGSFSLYFYDSPDSEEPFWTQSGAVGMPMQYSEEAPALEIGESIWIEIVLMGDDNIISVEKIQIDIPKPLGEFEILFHFE